MKVTAQELAAIIELASNAPIGSYANARRYDSLFMKFAKLHQQIEAGGWLTVLGAETAPTANLADTRGGVVIPAGGEPLAIQAAAVAAAESE
jgi:hypothetical protein